MCGIAFLFDPVGLERPERMKDMLSAIAHRGPDDEGIAAFVDGGSKGWIHHHGTTPQIVLGHRRLSILDLSQAGHQPMVTADGRYWITYNGEIYNYPDLRRECESRGWIFQSNTDTEAILALYSQHGVSFLNRLNGIFAFALVDLQKKRVLIARDRLGVKPLYIARAGKTWIAASEAKGIFASGLVTPSMDPRGLAEYLTFQNMMGRGTMFKGIDLLPAGRTLVLEADGSAKEYPYWDIKFVASEFDRKAAAEKLRGALEGAVKGQLLSDVPVGAYLSGGMDSGTVAAFAARHARRIPTFTAGFSVRDATGREQNFDERKDAEMMAEQFGTEIFELVLHARDLQEYLGKVVHHVEDPRVGMCYPGFMVSRLASRFVKVSLSGVGGDELLGGYPWRYRIALKASSESEFENQVFSYWCRLVPEDRRRDTFSAELMDALQGYDPRDAFREQWTLAAQAVDASLPPVERRIQQMMAFEMKTFLQGLLMVEDKTSMAHSLEARVPLLDNQVVDLALTLPPRLLVSEEFLAGKQLDTIQENLAGKRLMRDAMRGILPDSIIDRPKQGFSAPEESWYRTVLSGWVAEHLPRLETGSAPIIRPGRAQALLREHNAGSNHRLLIWSLLYLEHLDSGLGVTLERPWVASRKQVAA